MRIQREVRQQEALDKESSPCSLIIWPTTLTVLREEGFFLFKNKGHSIITSRESFGNIRVTELCFAFVRFRERDSIEEAASEMNGQCQKGNANFS